MGPGKDRCGHTRPGGAGTEGLAREPRGHGNWKHRDGPSIRPPFWIEVPPCCHVDTSGKTKTLPNGNLRTFRLSGAPGNLSLR